jgi:hypothetical protein
MPRRIRMCFLPISCSLDSIQMFFHTAIIEGLEVVAIEGSGETKGPESMLTGRSLFETEAKMLKC